MGNYYSGMMNSDYMRELRHHGIEGQKWGVRNGPPYPLGSKKSNLDINRTEKIADDISQYVDKYRGNSPAGNQNCQLCTWAMECQFRGMNVMPRPIYSPRDPALELNGCDIVKDPTKIHINSKRDVVSIVQESGDGSRYYMHVNWKGGAGGHEFIITNFGGKPYLVDAQAGIVKDVSDKSVQSYFNDVNYQNSFISRMDNKDLNSDILRYNDKKYVVNWDWKADVDYMIKNNMLSESDMKELKEKGLY